MSVKPFLALILFLGMNSYCCKKKEIEPVLEVKTPDQPIVVDPEDPESGPVNPFKHMLGVNGFEWEFIKDDSSNNFDDQKFELIKTFSGFRHYLDWERIEPRDGAFDMSFYDQIYRKTTDAGVEPLMCLQIIPGWMRKTYAEYNAADPFNSLRDYSPVPKGSDKGLPASYIDMAKAGFQIAARYGKNSAIDRSLVKSPSWEQSSPKIALNSLSYIECSNEPDKDWRGPQAQQTPEQYAAQLSAFYDGHMGTLGKDVGVKTADPQMKVVMAGIAFPNVDFVKRMINWCKANRVKDGKYTLCFDVINYHHYSNENMKVGKAPELSDVGTVAAAFVQLSKDNANNAEVWVTECGFDVNPRSPQRAIAIGSKTTYQTQADWTLRTSLLYARKGIKRTFFYMLNDVNIDDATQYASAGLLEKGKRRLSADYMLQAKNLMGEYSYRNTISADPIVDVYGLGAKRIYVLTIPDEKGRSANYTLDLGTAVKEVTLLKLKAGADQMTSEKVAVTNGKLVVNVTETPSFIQVN